MTESSKSSADKVKETTALKTPKRLLSQASDVEKDSTEAQTEEKNFRDDTVYHEFRTVLQQARMEDEPGAVHHEQQEKRHQQRVRHDPHSDRLGEEVPVPKGCEQQRKNR